MRAWCLGGFVEQLLSSGYISLEALQDCITYLIQHEEMGAEHKRNIYTQHLPWLTARQHLVVSGKGGGRGAPQAWGEAEGLLWALGNLTSAILTLLQPPTKLKVIVIHLHISIKLYKNFFHLYKKRTLLSCHALSASPTLQLWYLRKRTPLSAAFVAPLSPNCAWPLGDTLNQIPTETFHKQTYAHTPQYWEYAAVSSQSSPEFHSKPKD